VIYEMNFLLDKKSYFKDYKFNYLLWKRLSWQWPKSFRWY